MKVDINTLKEKYQKLWEEVGGDEELFLKLVKLKEKEKKFKEELKYKTEKERKREARALIILAKLLLKELDKEKLISFIETNKKEFIQKERKEEVDYSVYVLRLIEKK
jgi:hypothetical protein